MKTNELIKKFSFGLVDKVVEMIILMTVFGVNLAASGIERKSVSSITEESFETGYLIKEKMIEKAKYYAFKKGWLKQGENIEVTQAGLKKIKHKIPIYKKNRPWSGRLYLVTYDISEKRKALRDKLRNWLIDNKAKMIQKSVWVSVYDLRKELKVFKDLISGRDLILVSSLKKGEGIGHESMSELIYRLYKIPDINNRYKLFLRKFGRENLSLLKQTRAKFSYLAILQDDPQLPRELLPQKWYGDKAYKLFSKIQSDRVLV